MGICKQLLLGALTALVALGQTGSGLEWSGLPPLPRSAGVEGAFVAVVEGRLLLAGGIPVAADGPGSEPTNAAFVLDSPDGEWRETSPLPVALAHAAGASFGGSAILAGGLTGSDAAYSEKSYRLRFDGADLTFDELPDLPAAAAHASGSALHGTIYVAGGRQGSAAGAIKSRALRLDTLAESPAWEELPPLPGGPRLNAAVSAQDGAIFVFGGARQPQPDSGSRLEPASDGYRFTESSGWQSIADSPLGGSDTAVAIGPAHIASTRSGAGDGSATGSGRAIHAYHTVTDTWVSLGQAPAALAVARSVMWDGRLVLIGSTGPPGDTLPGVFAAAIEPDVSGFSRLDYITLAAYFSVLVMMGLYFARKGSSTEDFFLAGRRMPWWATGLSIFGTQLSSISFMAVPAKVYATDWVYFLLQMTIVMIAFPVVFFYLPYFRRTKMTSAYEYLETRFNLPVRLYASVSFVLYQLGRMAIVLFLPAIALSTVTGISVYACILVMGVLSTLYTVMGGIRAVIWTDVLQVFVLYGGALLSLGILLSKMDGGLSSVIAEGLEYDKFHMFNWTWDWTTTAVWVVLVGNLFMNLVPYTSDQAVVQRYFTTKDEKAAARSIWTNAILIVPSTLTLFVLGTGLWAFYRSNPELLSPALPTDSIFPLFISQHLPTGVVGLLIAAVFAASMSTLDSSLNSVSAALVTDFFVRFRPASSEKRRLSLAKWLTAGLGVLATATSIALATFDIGSLWDTFQGMMGLLGGGLAGLFALGIFFRRANGRGAMTGAIASVLILYWVQQHSDLHFFLYGAVGVLSCVGIGLVTSLAWKSSSGRPA